MQWLYTSTWETGLEISVIHLKNGTWITLQSKPRRVTVPEEGPGHDLKHT